MKTSAETFQRFDPVAVMELRLLAKGKNSFEFEIDDKKQVLMWGPDFVWAKVTDLSPLAQGQIYQLFKILDRTTFLERLLTLGFYSGSVTSCVLNNSFAVAIK